MASRSRRSSTMVMAWSRASRAAFVASGGHSPPDPARTRPSIAPRGCRARWPWPARRSKSARARSARPLRSRVSPRYSCASSSSRWFPDIDASAAGFGEGRHGVVGASQIERQCNAPVGQHADLAPGIVGFGECGRSLVVGLEGFVGIAEPPKERPLVHQHLRVLGRWQRLAALVQCSIARERIGVATQPEAERSLIGHYDRAAPRRPWCVRVLRGHGQGLLVDARRIVVAADEVEDAAQIGELLGVPLPVFGVIRAANRGPEMTGGRGVVAAVELGHGRQVECLRGAAPLTVLLKRAGGLPCVGHRIIVLAQASLQVGQTVKHQGAGGPIRGRAGRGSPRRRQPGRLRLPSPQPRRWDREAATAQAS